jgi:hypothetical protein
MNIGLVHPYLSYLLYFVILTGLTAWIGDFIKKKNDKITIVLSITNILSIIGFSIINSLFLIFIYSAGFFLNYDFWVNVIWIGVYIYCANEILKIFNEAFGNNKIYKLVGKLIITGPFLVSFIIFYGLFYGDKIYKISPHCENTNDPRIKVCKYSNGTYTGEMKAFRRHGQGEYIWDSGKTFKGKWIEGKVVE